MYARKKSVSMKLVVLLLAVVLVFGCAVGGTLAWLLDKTDPVVNTFTTANIDITLTETWNTDSNNDNTDDTWTAKLIPGTTIAKDPKVTVAGGSEACWLFVKVTEAGGGVTVGTTTYSFDDFVTYAMATGWTAVPDTTSVYYREVATSTTNQAYDVISGNQVSVPNTVTKAMLDQATGANAPSLTFTAYAVQKEGFADAASAWTEAQKLG